VLYEPFLLASLGWPQERRDDLRASHRDLLDKLLRSPSQSAPRAGSDTTP
jgi:hypothetical protein